MVFKTQVLEEIKPTAQPKINDFCITFCTINGSGSATANTTLLRAFYRMGIPVSGKNIFPSNIQGLPTWYTIRINKDGYLARVEVDDIVVAMNPATFIKDQSYLVPGGVLFYADDIKTPIVRGDIISYPMPVKKLARESNVSTTMRDYIANMVYVGVVAQILGMDLDMIYQALDYHFKGKAKAIESNFSVVKAAASWAAENLVKRDPYQVEMMDGTTGTLLSDGNTAAAIGAVFGGIQFAAWYPITPASSLAESIHEFLPDYRKDPNTGKDTCVIVQAEDEIAAIGMSIGAGWSGLRSMTSTSGPGFSLMTEYLGLAYFAEIPVVVWDVQRVGPSTGMPTRTAQGDLTEAYFLSHGDTQYIILIPGSVNECFEFGWKALDLAEHYQTPVIVLSDLDLGMNQWMTKEFQYPDVPIDRGKIIWEEDLEKMQGQWGRYQDIDGDGIPYRTVMGNKHPKAAYFTRGTGHDENARYSEDAEVWEKNHKRIRRKLENARDKLPAPEMDRMEGATISIVAMGSTSPAIEEARQMLLAKGIKTDYLRVRSIPFASAIRDFLLDHHKNYVVEINRDGQLNQLLTLELAECSSHLVHVSHMDGLPLSAKWIKEQIIQHEEY